MSVPDPSFENATRDFADGGWVVTLLGAAGVLVDMLLSDKEYPLSIWVRRTVAGVLTGIICYYSLHPLDMNPLTKSVLMCCSGALAPELLVRLRLFVKHSKPDEQPKKKKRR